MMKTYNVKLYNNSPELDLREKKTDIIDALHFLSVIDRSQRDVTYAKLISIDQHSMVIEVEESNDNWHKKFGKIMKRQGMENYCNPLDENSLFNWILVSK